MKLWPVIDKEGKFLGIINIIDFLVIGFLWMIIPAFILITNLVIKPLQPQTDTDMIKQKLQAEYDSKLASELKKIQDEIEGYKRGFEKGYKGKPLF